VVDQLAPDHVHYILWNVITQHLEVDYLDQMVIQWLNDNYRLRGYGMMLDGLHRNPKFWARLLEPGNLPKKIIKDFNNHRN
jgi:hypothetical protein